MGQGWDPTFPVQMNEKMLKQVYIASFCLIRGLGFCGFNYFVYLQSVE